MVVSLTILRADDSVYWTDCFRSQEECNAWLAEESKRPYWDKSFTTNIVVIEEPIKPPVDPAKQAEIAAAVIEVKEAQKTDFKSIEELSDLVLKMAVILGLR